MNTTEMKPAPGSTAGLPAPPATTAEPTAPSAPVAAQESQQGTVQQQAVPTPTPTEAVLTEAPVDFGVKTGIQALDDVASLLATQKFAGTDTILREVTETGQISLTSKADLVKALGPDIAKLVINQLEGSVAAAKEQATKEGERLKSYALERFGGQDGEAVWAGVQRFARSEASGFTAADRASMNKMLQAGGIQAEMVINEIARRYESSSGYTRQPNLLQGQSAGTQSFQPLSKQQYAEELRTVVQKYGYNSREANALQQRRAMSAQRGY